MLKELFKNIINRKPKESDDRTVLITFKDSLPKGEHNPRFVSAKKFTHKGQTYVSLQYRWYGGENADMIKIVVSQERHDALWERARKEWKEEQEESGRRNKHLDDMIRSMSPCGVRRYIKTKE